MTITHLLLIAIFDWLLLAAGCRFSYSLAVPHGFVLFVDQFDHFALLILDEGYL